MTTPFNFDELHNRRNNNSEKWTRYAEEVTPLWIADMDFTAPPAVVEGLTRISQNGIYGYGKARPDRVIDAITYRMKQLYNWQIKPESIVLLPGLVVGFNIAGNMIRRRNASANYIAMTPVYPPFLQMAENHDIECKRLPLACEVNEDRVMEYSLDIDGLVIMPDDNTELLMLCQPHNPVGHIFTGEECHAIERVAVKNDLVVVSDEIHAELTLEGQRHYPYALTSDASRDHTITLFAPSKTFNVAGLSGGFAIIENEALRNEYLKAMQGMVPNPNIYGMKGMELAFDYGDEWLVEVRKYLKANRDYLVDELKNMPGVRYTIPESTFLMWFDFSDTKLKDNAYEILLEHNVALSDGRPFGASGSCVRLNFAAPKVRLVRAINGLKEIFNL